MSGANIFRWLWAPWIRSFDWAKRNPVLAIFALAGVWVLSTAAVAWFVATVGKLFGARGLALVANRWFAFVVGLALGFFPPLWPVLVVWQLTFSFAFVREQLQ